MQAASLEARAALPAGRDWRAAPRMRRRLGRSLEASQALPVRVAATAGGIAPAAVAHGGKAACGIVHGAAEPGGKVQMWAASRMWPFK